MGVVVFGKDSYDLVSESAARSEYIVSCLDNLSICVMTELNSTAIFQCVTYLTYFTFRNSVAETNYIYMYAYIYIL